MNTQDIQKWFDEMEASRGIYDGLAEIGEGTFVSPQERLHEMLLKRFYGHTITLSLYDVKTFGDVTFEESIEFNFEDLAKNGFVSTIPFSSSSGSKGIVKLDWKSKYLTFIPDDKLVDDPMDRFFVYRIGQFHPSAVNVISDFKLDLRLLIDAYSVLDLNDTNDVLAISQEEETKDYINASPDFNMNDVYIKGGVLAPKGLGFIPERPSTFKEIAQITGVSASTLSDLKNGKKSIRNLTVETASLLSAYGHIKFVDSFLYDAFSRLKSVRTSEAEKRLRESVTHRVVIELKSGKQYELRLHSHKVADDFYMDIAKKLRRDVPTLELEHVYTQDDKHLAKWLVFKQDIACVYQDSVPSYDDEAIEYVLSKSE